MRARLGLGAIVGVAFACISGSALAATASAAVVTPTTQQGSTMYYEPTAGAPVQVIQGAPLVARANPLIETAASSNGSTHCFFSLSNGGPHYGCQFNHSTSNTILNAAFAGASGTVAGLVCAVAGGIPFLCAAAGGVVMYLIQDYLNPGLASGRCLEAGVYLPESFYVKKISCSIE